MSKDNVVLKKTLTRLNELLELQNETEHKFGSTDYNVFIFGSYINAEYVDGISDIDIAVYSKNFDLYKKISAYLEEYFRLKNIDSDIFYIDLDTAAPIYCAPLNSAVRFTDYFPPELQAFNERCRKLLDENKEKYAE